jgi:hypothetical protein
LKLLEDELNSLHGELNTDQDKNLDFNVETESNINKSYQSYQSVQSDVYHRKKPSKQYK